MILKYKQRLSNNIFRSLPTTVAIPLLTVMSKRVERSSSSSSCSRPSPKRNKHKSDDMESDRESDSPISLKQLLHNLNSMESKMEDNFSNLHSQIAQLTHEFKEEINGVKNSLKEFEKSLNSAWAFIEDLQQESKAFKDSKGSHKKMLDEQASEILRLKSELIKVKAENDKLTSSLKETQENLIALENYTRRENLRLMNIPESKNENCTDIVYDIIENDLNINPEEIRFHAVHRVGKPHARDDGTTPRPRPIIARFVVREDRDTVFSVKNRLKSSYRYSDAYITQDFARAIQQERKTLIQAMFAAKKKGRDAKVINRKLSIDDNAYDISNIPIDFKVASI